LISVLIFVVVYGKNGASMIVPNRKGEVIPFSLVQGKGAMDFTQFANEIAQDGRKIRRQSIQS
jgi:hypothetical protein